MSLVLARNEQIVNEWQYATSKGKGGNFSHDLTVTTKRIVVQEQSQNSAHHVEISVDSVKGVDLRYRKEINKLGILIALIGLVLLIVGAVNLKTSGVTMLIIGAAVFGIGVLIVMLLSRAQLVVIIYSDLDTDKGLGVYANSIPPVFKAFKRGKATRVKVNPNIAREIVSTLGSIILVK